MGVGERDRRGHCDLEKRLGHILAESLIEAEAMWESPQAQKWHYAAGWRDGVRRMMDKVCAEFIEGPFPSWSVENIADEEFHLDQLAKEKP